MRCVLIGESEGVRVWGEGRNFLYQRGNRRLVWWVLGEEGRRQVRGGWGQIKSSWSCGCGLRRGFVF